MYFFFLRTLIVCRIASRIIYIYYHLDFNFFFNFFYFEKNGRRNPILTDRVYDKSWSRYPYWVRAQARLRQKVLWVKFEHPIHVLESSWVWKFKTQFDSAWLPTVLMTYTRVAWPKVYNIIFNLYVHMWDMKDNKSYCI
jgi:hypothetical protein